MTTPKKRPAPPNQTSRRNSDSDDEDLGSYHESNDSREEPIAKRFKEIEPDLGSTLSVVKVEKNSQLRENNSEVLYPPVNENPAPAKNQTQNQNQKKETREEPKKKEITELPKKINKEKKEPFDIWQKYRRTGWSLSLLGDNILATETRIMKDRCLNVDVVRQLCSQLAKQKDSLTPMIVMDTIESFLEKFKPEKTQPIVGLRASEASCIYEWVIKNSTNLPENLARIYQDAIFYYVINWWQIPEYLEHARHIYAWEHRFVDDENLAREESKKKAIDFYWAMITTCK